MKKTILIFAIFSSLLFGASLDRKVELLETAVVKLIDENRAFKKEIERLKEVSKINTKKILKLDSRVQENKRVINKLNALKFNKAIKNNNTTFYAQVTAYMLNIREKPTKKSKAVGVLKKDDLVKIKGVRVNDEETIVWYEIDKGFISSSYTSLVKGRDK